MIHSAGLEAKAFEEGERKDNKRLHLSAVISILCGIGTWMPFVLTVSYKDLGYFLVAFGFSVIFDLLAIVFGLMALKNHRSKLGFIGFLLGVTHVLLILFIFFNAGPHSDSGILLI